VVTHAADPVPDRRNVGTDRRRKSRSGRRRNDPHVSAWRWRGIAWLFAGYAACLSVRSLVKSWPSTLKKRLDRRHPSN